MRAADRFDHLDGIRAVAITAVLGLHWFSWYGPFFHGGSVGVDVFFVLSGFIITRTLWSQPAGPVAPAWWDFLRRRVRRLYPALVGLVVGSVLLCLLVPWAPDGPREIAARGLLPLTQTSAVWAAAQRGSLWLPGLQPFGQTWSLAVEWYFYLAWPLVLLACRRAGLRPDRVAPACAAAAAVGYAAALPLGTFGFYFGPLGRSAELLAGAALALWSAGPAGPGLRRPGAAAWCSLLALAGYALLGADGHSPLYRWVGVPLAVTATVLLIRAGYSPATGGWRRLLAHRWVAGLGRASYSLYLWHVVPFVLLADVPTVPRPLLGAAAAAAAVALTAASHRWLERPFTRSRTTALLPHPAPEAPRAARHARPAP